MQKMLNKHKVAEGADSIELLSFHWNLHRGWKKKLTLGTFSRDFGKMIN